MIKIDNITKQYILGTIGGKTLNATLQSWWARKRGKEDPNTPIGLDSNLYNEKFLALNGVSFEVKKGERIGIIGKNGAGKSTLLKILSRVTTPTTGTIGLNGRISSMLEVGTGFHGELTGRENIYMNGAILGMSKKEIDSKIENIIDFSECRQFIDTPVKRYSSGMYVKLAFSVAAHLDNEILIMDEVLAVGDISFQQKCLRKMNDVSKTDGRTILYVSHNMNTIRQLCDRCIVLEKGTVIFDGDVEEGIEKYIGSKNDFKKCVDLESLPRDSEFTHHPITMTRLEFLDENNGIYPVSSKLMLRLSFRSTEEKSNVFLRIIIKTAEDEPVTMMTTSQGFYVKKDITQTIDIECDLSMIAPGKYLISPVMYDLDKLGNNIHLDGLKLVIGFEINEQEGFANNMTWRSKYWGHFLGKNLNIVAKFQ
ncbi:ABC transporter ATP-binding protein [bacterium]|nr:ABC transporter ATP-binding protein [bacterium]